MTDLSLSKRVQNVLLLQILYFCTYCTNNNTSAPPCLSRPQGAMSNERDYESVVMMRMRQAAERQKLIEQMQREDDEEAAGS